MTINGGGCGCGSGCCGPRPELVSSLHIEWRHLAQEGETCERCSGTGETLQRVVEELKLDMGEIGIDVSFSETRLGKEDVAQSNSILFNGRRMEDLLSASTKVVQSNCPSCSELIGEETCCRAIEHNGDTFEDIPEWMIQDAAWKAIIVSWADAARLRALLRGCE